MVALLTLTEVTQRSGVSASALRFYEARGLISATRSATNRRTYRRGVLRRLAVIRAAQAVGLSLGDVAEALAPFPVEATLNARQWARVAEDWQTKLTLRIEALTELRDGLQGCIGCGCLSMIDCPLYNPDDHLSAQGPGPRRMPAVTALAHEGTALAHEGTALATKSTREPPPSPR